MRKNQKSLTSIDTRFFTVSLCTVFEIYFLRMKDLSSFNRSSVKDMIHFLCLNIGNQRRFPYCTTKRHK